MDDGGSPNDRWLARRQLTALLMCGVAVIPSVFWVGTQEAFVRPKLWVASAILGLGFLVIVVPQNWGEGRWNRVDTAVALFAVLTVASHAASIDRSQSLWGEQFHRQGMTTLLLYCGVYAMARLAIVDRARLLLLAQAASLGSLPVAFYAVFQRSGFDPIWDQLPADRAFSSIGQPNSLGAYLAIAIPLSLGLALRGGRLAGVFASAAMVSGVALLYTESRGGLLGAAVGTAVLVGVLAVSGSWGWRRLAGGAAAIAVAGVLVVNVVPGADDSWSRAWERATADYERDSGSIRNHLDLWTVARHIIADNALLGTGPDTYPLVFGDYRDDVLSPASAGRLRVYRVESAHNIVLATGTNSGVPAMLLFVGVMGAGVAFTARDGIRRRDDGAAGGSVNAGLAGAITGGFVGSLFITADLTTTWVLWVLVGASVAAHAHGRDGGYPRSASASDGNAMSVESIDSHATNS